MKVETGRMQWVASTLRTNSEHGASSITTAYPHTSAGQQSTELTPSPADLNGLVRFARNTRSGFCACVVIFKWTSPFRAKYEIWFLRMCRHI